MDDMKRDTDMKMVNCTFCDGEMDCPESMLSAPSHICHYCGALLEKGYPEEKVGEVSQMMQKNGFFDMVEESENVAGALTDLQAEQVWKEEKKLLKVLSKDELSKTMFYYGASYTLYVFCMMGRLGKEFLKDFEAFAKAMKINDMNEMSRLADKHFKPSNNEKHGAG